MARRKKYHGDYRSQFEEDIAQELQPHGFSYESTQVPYTIERTYTPDFVYNAGDKVTYVEAKGFFRVGDTQKYRSIVRSLSWTEELVFILMKPDQKVSKGAKMTMSQWCDKEHIRWFHLMNLDELVDYVHT